MFYRVEQVDKKVRQESKVVAFKAKVRVSSRPSTLLPPPNPPTWSIVKECLQISTPTATALPSSPSSSYTPVSIPHNIVQRRLDMGDSSLTTGVQNNVTINNNSVTNYVSPPHLTIEDGNDEDADADSDSDSDSYSSD